MRDCKIDAASSRCFVCRKPASSANVRRNCTGPPGLGDWIAIVLDSVGITKQRVSQVTGGCGCQKRQEALNTFGSKVAKFFSRSRQHGEKAT